MKKQKLLFYFVLLLFSCTKDQQPSIVGTWHLTSEIVWVTFNSNSGLNSKDTSTNTDYISDFRSDGKVYHSYTVSGTSYYDTANYEVQNDDLVITGIHDSLSTITQHIDVLTNQSLTLHSVAVSTASKEDYWFIYKKN